jgi:hypothetical protein
MACFNIKKTIFPAQCIYVFCMILTVNIDYFPNSNNRLAFLMQMHSAYCEVGTNPV